MIYKASVSQSNLSAMLRAKRLKIYDTIRKYRGSALSRKITELQNSNEAQSFVRKTIENTGKYGLRVREIGELMGKGLFSSKGIPKKGIRFGLYPGELTDDEATRGTSGDYLIGFPYFKEKMVLDGQKRIKMGEIEHWNIGYINHSCRLYNCKLVTVWKGKCPFIVCETLRKIRAKEQITINYNNGIPSDLQYWLEEEYEGQAEKLYGKDATYRCECEKPCPLKCYHVMNPGYE